MGRNRAPPIWGEGKSFTETAGMINRQMVTFCGEAAEFLKGSCGAARPVPWLAEPGHTRDESDKDACGPSQPRTGGALEVTGRSIYAEESTSDQCEAGRWRQCS